jgi:hypothetical protein
MSTPYQRQEISFCTLAAEVEAAALSADSLMVVGRWTQMLARRVRPQGLVEDFANWSSDPLDIARFTKRHGPLTVAQVGRGQDFSFSVADWEQCQRQFREDWKGSRSGALGWRNTLDAEQGERFSRIFGKLTYVASTLFRMLQLELRAIPPHRLRRCAKPDCEHPYFVAPHLRQRYCSTLCVNWAQKKWKRQWWTEHGDGARRQQATRNRKRQKLRAD